MWEGENEGERTLESRTMMLPLLVTSHKTDETSTRLTTSSPIAAVMARLI
jgi:hypothetical protein